MKIMSSARWEALVAREAIFGMQDVLILTLRQQITKLEDRLNLALDRQDREQQRADNALSTVFAVKTGVQPDAPPVAPSLPELDPHAEDDAVVEEIRQNIKDKGPIETLLGYK